MLNNWHKNKTLKKPYFLSKKGKKNPILDEQKYNKEVILVVCEFIYPNNIKKKSQNFCCTISSHLAWYTETFFLTLYFL